MKDEALKIALSAIALTIADLAETQSIVMQILSKQLTGLPEDTQNKLLQCAQNRRVLVDNLNLVIERVQKA